jgi:hypothetical protein
MIKGRSFAMMNFRPFLETDANDMFEMNRWLAKHIIPLDPTSNFFVSYLSAFA